MYHKGSHLAVIDGKIIPYRCCRFTMDITPEYEKEEGFIGIGKIYSIYGKSYKYISIEDYIKEFKYNEDEAYEKFMLKKKELVYFYGF